MQATHDPRTKAASFVTISTAYQLQAPDVETHPRKVWNYHVEANGSCQPHGRHDWQHADQFLLPSNELVLGRKLESDDRKLDSNDNSANALSFVNIV